MASYLYTSVYYCSGAGAGNSLKEGGMFWSLLMIISFFLQAAGTVLKVIMVYNVFCIFPTVKLFFCSYIVLFIFLQETIFLDSTQKLKVCTVVNVLIYVSANYMSECFGINWSVFSIIWSREVLWTCLLSIHTDLLSK